MESLGKQTVRFLMHSRGGFSSHNSSMIDRFGKEFTGDSFKRLAPVGMNVDWNQWRDLAKGAIFDRSAAALLVLLVTHLTQE